LFTMQQTSVYSASIHFAAMADMSYNAVSLFSCLWRNAAYNEQL